ncbi:hypothetical protein WEH80_31695 [Actinomycetes bacterium KLBMP 9759]
MTTPHHDQQQNVDDPRTEVVDARTADPHEPRGSVHQSDSTDTDTTDTDRTDTDRTDTDRTDTDRTDTDRTEVDRAGQPEMQAAAAQPDADTSATRGMAGAGDADRMQPEGETLERLVPSDRATEYGTRWDSVKGSFVDEPREAVTRADALVGELLGDLEKLFREQRTALESKLESGETSTEELRLALRRYRSLFDRLLSV